MTRANLYSKIELSSRLIKAISTANAAKLTHNTIKEEFRAAEVAAKAALKEYAAAEARHNRAGSAQHKNRTNATITEANAAFYAYADARKAKDLALSKKRELSDLLAASKFSLRTALAREELAGELLPHTEVVLLVPVAEDLATDLRERGISALLPGLLRAAQEEDSMFQALRATDDPDEAIKLWSEYKFSVDLLPDVHNAKHYELNRRKLIEYRPASTLVALVFPATVLTMLVAHGRIEERLGVPKRPGDICEFDSYVVTGRALEQLAHISEMHLIPLELDE